MTPSRLQTIHLDSGVLHVVRMYTASREGHSVTRLIAKYDDASSVSVDLPLPVFTFTANALTEADL